MDQADYFLVPLLDGAYGVGQIIAPPEAGETAPFCALTDLRQDGTAAVAPFPETRVTALARIAPDAITGGQWPTAGFDQLPRFEPRLDIVGMRALGWKEYPIHDPAVIEAFLSAWHGLYDWTAFGDLFDRIKRPHLDRPGAAP